MTRINNISTESYSGTLYDLQMKSIHNYTTTNGLIHNGGGKRNGSIAIYLEPWHADVFDFLALKKIVEMKKIEHVIFFMRFGYPIYLWNV